MSAPAALALTDAGYAVVPLVPATKRPAVGWRDRAGPATRRALSVWFRDGRRGVGVLTGGPSGGLTVLDLDGHEAERWAAGAGLPHGAEVRTARGRHLWYRTPPGVTLPSGTAVLGVRGLDLRAAGGYVVAPDTVHPSGRPYEWTRAPWDRPPPPLPERLLTDLLRPSWHAGRVDVFALLDGVEEGRRNDAAARVCGHLLARGLSGDTLHAAMTTWNQRNRPPLAANELSSVVRSIERADARKRAESREALRPTLEAAWAERPCRGARAGTDCDVYATHLRFAWRAGRLTWHASIRDLAMESWTGQWTARAATARLVNAGLLARVSSAEGARAAVFALPLRSLPLDPLRTAHKNWESGWILPEEEEGLSGEERAALSVLRRLGRVSAVGVALALGVENKTAAARLRALEALGLAEETPDGWRADEGDARAIEARKAARAAERGRQAQAVEEERQVWRERVARGADAR